MASKRKADDGNDEGPSGREKKKQKMNAARVISVQAAPQATSSGAGPSRTTPAPAAPPLPNSMSGLPSTLDVERFVESRTFEINAMHEALGNAKDASTHRAWQELPRHLRRRAASHNSRRVPVRLREKAKSEIDPAKKKALKHAVSKRGKSKSLTRTEEFLKRQIDKTWLETHIWHAKRMHMETRWGYRLAATPTDKSARPSYRASVHGAILHDASYYGVIELVGSEKVLMRLLGHCCDPQGGGVFASRYTSGSRALETSVYTPGTYPFGLLGPATVIWRPLPTANPEPSRKASVLSNSARRKAGKSQAKAKDTVTKSNHVQPDIGRRTVWVRVHPAIFSEVFNVLRESAGIAIQALRAVASASSGGDADRENGETTGVHEYSVEIADLREQLNIFEIIGPLSSQVIFGALKPVNGDQRPEFQEFWSALSQLQTSGQLPRSTVVGFTVQDPRLNFPPKNAKAKAQEQKSSIPNVAVPTSIFGSVPLARSDIWDESIRGSLRKPRFKKKDIDSRKSKNLIPGTALSSTNDDDRIPLLLIQHSVSPSSTSATSKSASHDLYGWTLIIPSGWAMPFLSSLIFTGTRVGGFRERDAQAFEVGVPVFPRDYITTAQYSADVSARAEEARARWERTPKSKRINYELRGIDHPWQPDWEGLLGLERLTAQVDATNTADDSAGLTSAQRDDESMAVDEAPPQILRPWVLCGPDTQALVEEASLKASPAAGLHAALNSLRSKRGMPPLLVSVSDLWRSALVWVRLDACSRGRAEEGATLFCVDDIEGREWSKAVLSGDIQRQSQLGEATPTSEALCGYITSGGFSLSEGRTHAIGAVALSKFFELLQQAQRLRGTMTGPTIKFRNRNDVVCHVAKLEVLCR